MNIATWNIQLLSDCPHCERCVDLLEYSDFWDGHPGLIIGDSRSESTTDAEVTCPACLQDFRVNIEY